MSKEKYHETDGFKFSIHRNWVRVQSAKKAGHFKICTISNEYYPPVVAEAG